MALYKFRIIIFNKENDVDDDDDDGQLAD